MVSRLRSSFFSCLVFGLLASACGGGGARDDGGLSAEQRAVGDIASMTSRGDGSFDVICSDGRREVASAADVTSDHVCAPQQEPPPPFAATCSGAPLTSDEAIARLPRAFAAGDAPVVVGRFSLALRHRNEHFSFDASRGRWVIDEITWDDAPTDALVAWREDFGDGARSNVAATFTGRGQVELGLDENGAPFLRLVSDPAAVVGPDTTQRMRFVSTQLRPWSDGARGPQLSLERSTTASPGAWTAVPVSGSVSDGGTFSIQMRQRDEAGFWRSWWFGSAATAFATESCASYVSVQSQSQLSAIDGAIAIFASF